MKQKCIWCGKETLTLSHPSRKKKYCNNTCQMAYERKMGLRFKQPTIPKEILEDLYLNQKLSCLKIARQFNIKLKQVSRFLKKYEIPTRSFSTSGLLRREDNPNWKGGTSPINSLIRASTEYRLWRLDVFERDKYTCVLCGKKGGDLQADHIKPFAYFPELRFDRKNGRTLCIKCHRKTDTFGRKYETLLTKKQTHEYN